MKPLVCGAVLGLLWLLAGVPLAVPVTVLAAVVQPVAIAFAAGLLTRPYLTRRRWER